MDSKHEMIIDLTQNMRNGNENNEAWLLPIGSAKVKGFSGLETSCPYFLSPVLFTLGHPLLGHPRFSSYPVPAPGS